MGDFDSVKKVSILIDITNGREEKGEGRRGAKTESRKLEYKTEKTEPAEKLTGFTGLTGWGEEVPGLTEGHEGGGGEN